MDIIGTDRDSSNQLSAEEQVALTNILRVIVQLSPLEDALLKVLKEILAVPWIRIAKKGAIFLTEGDPKELKLACQIDLSPQLLKLCETVPFGHCLCGRAAESQTLQFSSCVDARHEVIFEGMKPHGHYNVPIISADETLGVIVLYLPDGFERKEAEVSFLEAIADALGTLILRERATQALIQANDDLAKAKETALRAAKSKSEFLANMSHEIRTPMSGILGTLELLDTSTLEKEQQNLIEVATSSAESLLVIVNDILDFSKIESGKMNLSHAPFLLSSTLNSVVKMLTPIAERNGVTLNLNFTNKITVSHLGDAQRLRQILVNLVGNAIKFSPYGAVNISIQTEDIEGGSSTQIKFLVKDDGIGISKEQSERIFKRYEQAEDETSSNFGGTGLGLAICRSLVESMNGQIGVESTLGQGSVFWFEIVLPTNDSKTLISDELVDHKKISANILVVDDNGINRLIAKKMLENFGCKVETANDGREAVQCVTENKYNLVLMDCQMPTLNGLEATKIIRENSKFDDLPIIALTADVMDENREHCLKVGMSDVMFKPLQKLTIYQMLERWI